MYCRLVVTYDILVTNQNVITDQEDKISRKISDHYAIRPTKRGKSWKYISDQGLLLDRGEYLESKGAKRTPSIKASK